MLKCDCRLIPVKERNCRFFKKELSFGKVHKYVVSASIVAN